MTVRQPHPLKKILQNRKIKYESAAKMTGYSRDRFESLLNGRGKMNSRAKAAFDVLMTQLVEDNFDQPGRT